MRKVRRIAPCLRGSLFTKKRLFCDHVYSLKCMYDGLVLLWPHGEKDGRYVLGGQHGYVDVPSAWVWLGAVPREGRLEGREVFRNIWARESWRWSLSSNLGGRGGSLGIKI